MKKDKTTLYSCYDLLHNVLQDAFHVESFLFEPPYKDLAKIDQGLRAIVWTDYNDEKNRIRLSENAAAYRMFIIKSNLGFYNILAFFVGEEKPDFISVGPFRDEQLSANYYTQILKDSHLTPLEIQGMKHRYERMPFVEVNTVVRTMQHIISAFIPEFAEVVPEQMQYSEQNRVVAINEDLLQNYSIEFTTKYKERLFSFLGHIKRGNLADAKEALNQFLQEGHMLGSKNIRENKLILHMLNDYCHMALLDTTIHPSHIMMQAFSLKARIDELTSRTKLEQMAGDICRKYCLLVRNFANPEYSKITRDVIDYIQLHMDEELSLNYFATYFNKNASVLSSTFSKETGMSLTKFIHRTRIQEAVRYFNTTDKSVSEVAVTVGYQDFSYFSKLFTREIGCSPREYKMKKVT